MTIEPFRVPNLLAGPNPGARRVDGWIEEVQYYVVTPRPKPKFKAVLSADALFGRGGVRSSVTTRISDGSDGGDGGAGERRFELHITHQLGDYKLSETLMCRAEQGLHVTRFQREIEGTGGVPCRVEDVQWLDGPLAMPPAAYPEVTLPFVMRGQPLDGKARSAWSWTNDRMMARVYYEVRRRGPIDVPAGRFEAAEVWMYPDLNDWISLGSLVTRLAKPLIPRYNIWFESAPPHRVLRFEGPYGPPSSPEIVLELCDP